MSSDEKNLNKELLNKLKAGIFMQEKSNIKTKKKSDSDMVDIIRKLIQLEVDKNDNQTN